MFRKGIKEIIKTPEEEDFKNLENLLSLYITMSEEYKKAQSAILNFEKKIIRDAADLIEYSRRKAVFQKINKIKFETKVAIEEIVYKYDLTFHIKGYELKMEYGVAVALPKNLSIKKIRINS
jgi:hypothetical protein